MKRTAKRFAIVPAMISPEYFVYLTLLLSPNSKLTYDSLYDFIYITPDFSVSQIHYLYDEAIEAGSDHAMVMSDLTYTS
jgi:hypothetical protein